MKTEYTPGPHTTFSADIIDELEPLVIHGGEVHAIVPADETGNAQEEAPVIGYAFNPADAELWAAAPRLLEALKTLTSGEAVDKRDYAEAEAAIAQAEGRN